jgi:hypothetical protein
MYKKVASYRSGLERGSVTKMRIRVCNNKKILFCSVADPDPRSGASLAPGSGFRCLFGPKKHIRIRIRDEQPGSYFRELRNNFLGFKYFNSLMRIRDPGWKKFGPGINIPDPQHCYSEQKLLCRTFRLR